MKTEFVSPYASLPEDRQHRSSFISDKIVAHSLAGIRGRRDTLQVTVNVLLQKFYEQLRIAGIVSYAPTEYDDALLNATITIGRGTGGTESPPKPKANRGNVRRRATGVV